MRHAISTAWHLEPEAGLDRERELVDDLAGAVRHHRRAEHLAARFARAHEHEAAVVALALEDRTVTVTLVVKAGTPYVTRHLYRPSASRIARSLPASGVTYSTTPSSSSSSPPRVAPTDASSGSV